MTNLQKSLCSDYSTLRQCGSCDRNAHSHVAKQLPAVFTCEFSQTLYRVCAEEMAGSSLFNARAN